MDRKKKSWNEIAFPYSEFLIYENSRHDVQKKNLLQQQNKQTDADNFSQQKEIFF